MNNLFFFFNTIVLIRIEILILLYLISSGIACLDTKIDRGPTFEKNPVSSDAVLTTASNTSFINGLNKIALYFTTNSRRIS